MDLWIIQHLLQNIFLVFHLLYEYLSLQWSFITFFHNCKFVVLSLIFSPTHYNLIVHL